MAHFARNSSPEFVSKSKSKNLLFKTDSSTKLKMILLITILEEDIHLTLSGSRQLQIPGIRSL